MLFSLKNRPEGIQKTKSNKNIKQYQKEKSRAKKEQNLVRLLRKEVEIGGGGTQEYVIKNGVNKGRIAKGFQK